MKPTDSEVLNVIRTKAKQGFDFRVSRYSYRDQKLRKICKKLHKEGRVSVSRERDVFVITPKEQI